MATRPNPYGNFNFMVKLGDTGGEDQIAGGFSDVSGLGNEVKFSEYRNGNDRENDVRKLTGLTRVENVTLRRGVIGSLDLYNWLNDIRNGNEGALRTVTIQLLSEDHTQVVETWKLMRARIVKHVSGPFNAKASDVAMEEIELAYERLELE